MDDPGSKRAGGKAVTLTIPLGERKRITAELFPAPSLARRRDQHALPWDRVGVLEV